MNQIISFDSAKNTKVHLKKVISFFSFFIIIFAIILIAEGILGFKSGKEQKVNIVAPKISIERLNEITLLKVNSQNSIREVKYYWKLLDEGTIGNITEEQVRGQNEFEIEIATLNGTNELYIEILDDEGNIIKYNPIKISYENTEEMSDGDWEKAVKNDKTKPVITLESISGKLKISATDNLRMSYIVYSWNGGNETTISGLSDDEKTVTDEITVGEGTNKLTVKAYDRAGNEAVMEKEIQGVKGPTIKVLKDGSQLVIKVTDETGITKIDYEFNNQKYTIEDINLKSYEFRLDLVDGQNYIIIDAYRADIKSNFKGKTTK